MADYTLISTVVTLQKCITEAPPQLLTVVLSLPALERTTLLLNRIHIYMSGDVTVIGSLKNMFDRNPLLQYDVIYDERTQILLTDVLNIYYLPVQLKMLISVSIT